MIIEAVLMLLPAIVAAWYGEFSGMRAFLLTASGTALLGLLLCLQAPKSTELYAKEGLVIVGMVWIMWSLAGAFPFYISGEIPQYIDAFFEMVSGFTTTGATILTDIEAMSMGMHFWRAFSHWIGGMGVLVFAMAIISVSSKNSIHLMRAEVPGPTVSKLVPRGMKNAKILYGLYFALSFLEFVFLVAGGMPVFDSVIHTFSTAGTGGFSLKNTSIAFYNSAYIEWVITVFMFLFGINFNIYYFLIVRKFAAAAKNSEWKLYLAITVVASLCIATNIRHLYSNTGTVLRTAVFQTVSIMTTTGFSTADFNHWGGFTHTILLLLMAIGACAGSTGGGLKVARLIIYAKTIGNAIRGMLRPNTITQVKMDGRVLESTSVHAAETYLIVYAGVFIISLFLVSINNFRFEESASIVISCLNNVGPGLGSLGPEGNYSHLSGFSKIILSLDMLLGRLEFFPVLMLMFPNIWKRKFL